MHAHSRRISSTLALAAVILACPAPEVLAKELAYLAGGRRDVIDFDDKRFNLRKIPRQIVTVTIPDNIDRTQPFDVSCSVSVFSDVYTPGRDRSDTENVKVTFSSALYLLDHQTGRFETIEMESGTGRTDENGVFRVALHVDPSSLGAGFPGDTSAIFAFSVEKLKGKKSSYVLPSCFSQFLG